MKKRLGKHLHTAGIITCACALLAALAGCTGGNTSSGTSSSGLGTETASSSAESAVKHEVRDLNGYKWSYLSLWGTESARFNPVEGHSGTDDAYLERNRQLMEDYNFTIEMKSQSLDNFDQAIIGAAMAGEKIADIICLEYSRMQSMRVAEILNPFDSTCMPNINLDDAKWLKAFTEGSTFNGKVYGVGDEPGNATGSMIFFNATLLQEQNVTSPYDLYKEGKWTWEEFQKLAKKMTIDNNGDGTPDIYGIGYANWATFHFETPFIYSNGGNAVKFDDSGNPRFGFTDNDAQEALEFVRGLYAEKVIIPELPNDDGKTAALLSTRKVAFVTAQCGFSGWLKEMEDDFGMVPYPKGPSADDYIAMSAQLPMFVTTIGTPKADYDASSLIFDLLTEPLPPTGDDTVDDPLFSLRNEVFRDDTAVEIYQDMNNKVVPCQSIIIPGLPGVISEAIISCTQENATTPKSAMESIADQAQTLINDFFTKKTAA